MGAKDKIGVSIEQLEMLFEKAKDVVKGNVKDPYKFQTELGETAREVAKGETAGGRRRLGNYKPATNVIGNLMCAHEESFYEVCNLPPRPMGMEFDDDNSIDQMILQLKKEREKNQYLYRDFVQNIYQSSIANGHQGIDKVSEMVKDIKYPQQIPGHEFPTPTSLSSKD